MRAPYGSIKDYKAYFKRKGEEFRKRNPNYMREYLKKYRATYTPTTRQSAR
jgi:hypothetical protein